MAGAIPASRQEPSVERLKSCIADLKKLATNKVKRGQSHAHGASRGQEDSSYTNYSKYSREPDYGRKSSAVAAHSYKNNENSNPQLTSSKTHSRSSLRDQSQYSSQHGADKK
jgi:hypothetical protein